MLFYLTQRMYSAITGGDPGEKHRGTFPLGNFEKWKQNNNITIMSKGCNHWFGIVLKQLNFTSDFFFSLSRYVPLQRLLVLNLYNIVADFLTVRIEQVEAPVFYKCYIPCKLPIWSIARSATQAGRRSGGRGRDSLPGNVRGVLIHNLENPSFFWSKNVI